MQLTYNGEVYNFRELRAELEPLGHTFHTSCDTEVVLHAYLEWGTDCFARFNGMWALAILDLRDGDGDVGRAPRLVLARDHYGIKPLYYARSGSGRVLFASEAKAVLADPELETAPDRQWLYDYLLHGLHDHQPQTAFAGIRALAAATWAVVDADGVHEQTYWTPTLSSDAACRPGRVPRPLRAVGGAAAGGRRPRRHLPVGRDRLVVDRRHGEQAARRSTYPTRCRSAIG